jgi:hypothetical protein
MRVDGLRHELGRGFQPQRFSQSCRRVKGVDYVDARHAGLVHQKF